MRATEPSSSRACSVYTFVLVFASDTPASLLTPSSYLSVGKDAGGASQVTVSQKPWMLWPSSVLPLRFSSKTGTLLSAAQASDLADVGFEG